MRTRRPFRTAASIAGVALLLLALQASTGCGQRQDEAAIGAGGGAGLEVPPAEAHGRKDDPLVRAQAHQGPVLVARSRTGGGGGGGSTLHRPDRLPATERLSGDDVRASAGDVARAGDAHADSTCEQAYNAVSELSHDARAHTPSLARHRGGPDRRSFLDACRLLPPDMQHCLVPAYQTVHADECEKLQKRPGLGMPGASRVPAPPASPGRGRGRGQEEIR